MIRSANHWKKFFTNNIKIRSGSMLTIETIDSKIYEMQVIKTRIESRKGAKHPKTRIDCKTIIHSCLLSLKYPFFLKERKNIFPMPHK
jgi:hypothetical protein